MVLGSDNPYPISVGSFQVPVVPPDVDPDEGQQFTVCFSVDWLPFIVGALQQLTLQATWAGDTATVLQAQDRAQHLIAMFGSDYGGCGSTVCLTDLIYDADCDCIKQTFDGGETYVEQPAGDPRHNTAFLFPPVEADDVACQAAANMSRWISDLIDQILLTVDAAGTFEGLAAIILPFVIELGPFGILIELVLGLAFILFGAGATAIAAAFPNELFDTLTCIFYCNIDANGRADAAALESINTAIDDQIGGLAATVLHAMFLLTGEVGLSNAGTIGDAPADCSDCDCGWCYEWDFTSSDGGWDARVISGLDFAVYSAGVGWGCRVQNDGCSNHAYCYIIKSFGFATSLIEVCEYDLQAAEGGFDANQYNGQLSGTQVTSNPFDNGSAITHTTAVTATSQDEAWISVNQCDEPAGFFIQKIRFSGHGTMPSFTGGAVC